MSTVSSTASLLSSATNASTSSSTSSTSSSSSTSSTSDIDWDALIEEAVQAKLSKADSIDVKISTGEAKIAAYQEMQTLLGDMLDAAESLRAASGYSVENVFDERAAYLSASGVTASDYMGATVENGAQEGSYEVEIVQLAKAHKIAGGTQASSTTGLGLSGTISLGTSGGSAVEITIESDMSLQEIAEEINNQKDNSGVQASVLKVSETEFRLILSTVETGQTIEIESSSGDLATELGFVDENGDIADELQAAANAIFTIDGVTIERSSNDVSDAIDGITLHLYEETGSAITVEVGTDLSAVKQAIADLVDAYNAYREWAYTYQSDTTSILFGDSTLRNVNSAISTALGTSISDTEMSLLGLSYDESNNLVLDEDTLDSALVSNLEDIKKLLAYSAEFSSSDMMLLSRGTETPGDFTLDITVNSEGAIQSASVAGDASLFEISGTRIIGREGTIYEDFVFVYAGETSKSVDVSLSTGITELLYNAVDAAANTDDGSVQALIDSLEESASSMQTKSDDIRSAAEDYRTKLTERYATYQAAIEQAESVQEYLTQLLESWNSSS